MRMNYEAVMAGLIERLALEGEISEIKGELTGEKQAGQAQVQLLFTVNGEERCFRYHVRREAPVHTIARSMAEDTLYTLPQRVIEGVTGRLQPNDVYYPSALGNTPTNIPGQPSGVVWA
jgi:hypothetical protein